MTRIVIRTGASAPITLDIEDTGDNAPVHLHLPSDRDAAPVADASEGQPKENRPKWRAWGRPAALAGVGMLAVLVVLRVTAPVAEPEPPLHFARLPPISGDGPDSAMPQNGNVHARDDRQALLQALKQPVHVEPPPGVPTASAPPAPANAFGLEN
ncbi:hypothetical protein [Acetobacter sp.]|uniref:hypothetical protein n=1 Tax=Acetobacter sp. TaxID=440 RepID=UPI0039E7B5A5